MKFEKVGMLSGHRLGALIDRLVRLDEEAEAIASDIRDIYTEAKDHGYNPIPLRAIAQDLRWHHLGVGVRPHPS
jgi:uncharacterized protein (UPF0335 family)